jgi:hypothetical protein
MFRIKASSFLKSVRVCMRALISPMVLLWIIHPSVSKADAIFYTLTTNVAGVNGAAPGTVLDWQFLTPSILTNSTVIGSFLRDSVGGSRQ